MGLFSGITDAIGGAVDWVDDTFLGGAQAEAADDARDFQIASTREAMEEMRRSKDEGLGFLSPFGVLGQQGLDNAGFLTDPNQQFQYLQNNPLFKLALQNANRGTQQSAAAGGRLSAGDTLQQLSNDVLLSAQSFLNRQNNNIMDLLGMGTDLARSQANTSLGVGSQLAGFNQDIGNSQAAGEIGQANARSQGVENAINIGGIIAGLPW